MPLMRARQTAIGGASLGLTLKLWAMDASHTPSAPIDGLPAGAASADGAQPAGPSWFDQAGPSEQDTARRSRRRQQGPAPTLVPIRTLGSNHRSRIQRHLLALNTDDRYLRFGYPATDEQIRRYVQSLNFERDDIFGIYNRRIQLVAVAHLAYSTDAQFQSCAEFGVSVSASVRGRGFGSRLFDRAVMHARNQNVRLLFIHALSENAPMLAIARKSGARLERDGSETEAYLTLPNATLDSHIAELVEEQMAQTDYQLKLQAQRFVRAMKSVNRTSEAWLRTVQRVATDAVDRAADAAVDAVLDAVPDRLADKVIERLRERGEDTTVPNEQAELQPDLLHPLPPAGSAGLGDSTRGAQQQGEVPDAALAPERVAGPS